MARRSRRDSFAALAALSLRKPCPLYGPSRPFDRWERRNLLGNAGAQPKHGGYREAMPQKDELYSFRDRQEDSMILPTASKDALLGQYRHLHAYIHHRFIRSSSNRNYQQQQSSGHIPEIPFTSPLARSMDAWLLIHSSATGGEFMQVRSVCSIIQHDPVQECTTDDKLGTEKKKKPLIAVVLLGWLGAKHRHLRKYADWYISHGMYAITFTIPMRDVLTWRAEKHVEILSQHLLELRMSHSHRQDQESFIIFHTFSNTGWMSYGVLLERLLKSSEGLQLVKKIKGCVVDSGPAPKNEPRVWAAGLCANILKKNSMATQAQLKHEGKASNWREDILMALLEKIVAGFLRIPYIKRRIDDVTSVLSRKQPPCPQLYLYSNADTVISAMSIESFLAEQQRAGRRVQACNFFTSPHVDHFRSFPAKYMKQLASFLESCQLQHVKASECVAESKQ